MKGQVRFTRESNGELVMARNNVKPTQYTYHNAPKIVDNSEWIPKTEFYADLYVRDEHCYAPWGYLFDPAKGIEYRIHLEHLYKLLKAANNGVVSGTWRFTGAGGVNYIELV